MTSSQEVLQRIARRLRQERQALGLTQAALAERSGVSPRMLALIEKAETNPSIATLAEIAAALGLDFADLFGGGDTAPAQVIPPEDFATVWQSPAGSARLLTSGGRAELWDWALVAGACYDATPDPAGTVELILVLEGTLVLEVDGAALAAPAGHALRLASDRSYAYRAEGGPVRFVRVVSPGGR
ncbi:helix-turn-helix domain-containing protein [Inquilinus limosus]|uniref:helix-turn-helix domain-containing protein n=1 Tax=Inquilinus limosus TaxID=171674 RepID=UPI003F184B0B